MTTSAQVWLWGRQIGAVALDERGIGRFEYVPSFVGAGIEVSPLLMPVRAQVYEFPSLRGEPFHGLPGLLADSLPDRFGTALIDAWLAREGRPPGSLNAVERLCYTGERGMGALTFRPAHGPSTTESVTLNMEALVALASHVLHERDAFTATYDDTEPDRALQQLLQVGTSAGGARAKAVIAWNPTTQEIRSGQAVTLGAGFEHWLLKFDGVARNGDRGLADPQGYGTIEFVYSEMARCAGIDMMPCRLLAENGRRHFMTRRFDRTDNGERLHVQTLGALAHLDYNNPLAHNYEQAFTVAVHLGLGYPQREQLVRRMIFNVIARNQDDHVKNLSFLMTKDGTWALAPAYDITWNFNPHGDWTRQHQMAINGKRDCFEYSDFETAAKQADIKPRHVREALRDVLEAVRQWDVLAQEYDVDAARATAIKETFRLDLS
jgi:serine/threonine-protein kinase HipA